MGALRRTGEEIILKGKSYGVGHMKEEEEETIFQTRRSNTCKTSSWEGAEGTERKKVRLGLMNKALKQRGGTAGHLVGPGGASHAVPWAGFKSLKDF